MAFNTAAGHYKHLVMLFSLTNAFVVFQNLVNDVSWWLRSFWPRKPTTHCRSSRPGPPQYYTYFLFLAIFITESSSGATSRFWPVVWEMHTRFFVQQRFWWPTLLRMSRSLCQPAPIVPSLKPPPYGLWHSLPVPKESWTLSQDYPLVKVTQPCSPLWIISPRWFISFHCPNSPLLMKQLTQLMSSADTWPQSDIWLASGTEGVAVT